jgi:hypothetical protein
MYLPDELVTRDQRRRVGERLAPHIRTRLPRHADPALLTARACPLWDGRSYVYLEGSRKPGMWRCFAEARYHRNLVEVRSLKDPADEVCGCAQTTRELRRDGGIHLSRFATCIWRGEDT